MSRGGQGWEASDTTADLAPTVADARPYVRRRDGREGSGTQDPPPYSEDQDQPGLHKVRAKPKTGRTDGGPLLEARCAPSDADERPQEAG